jgi:hypothetical protein
MRKKMALFLLLGMASSPVWCAGALSTPMAVQLTVLERCSMRVHKLSSKDGLHGLGILCSPSVAKMVAVGQARAPQAVKAHTSQPLPQDTPAATNLVAVVF